MDDFFHIFFSHTLLKIFLYIHALVWTVSEQSHHFSHPQEVDLLQSFKDSGGAGCNNTFSSCPWADLVK